jgi:hypothetical protein
MGGPFGRISEILASSHARPDLRGGFFVPRVGIGFCAFWVVAARLLMSLPGVSLIAAGWSFAVRRRGIRLSDRGPFPTGCISPIPVGPFGSRDDGSNPSPSASSKPLFHLMYFDMSGYR